MISVKKVLVVDDHNLIAHGLTAELRGRNYEAESLSPSSQRELAETLAARAGSVDLVLLDIDLGNAGRSLPLVHSLVEGGARVLMVSGSTDDPEVGACLEAGACGFVAKSEPFDALMDAVDRALRGVPVLSEAERLAYLTALWDFRGRQIEIARPFRRLTDREAEVLHLLCEGLPVQAIAERAFLSVPTVRTHVRGILTKLGASSQLEAVAQAYRSGWHIMRSVDEAC